MYTYFISNGVSIKIGRSVDVAGRLQQLQSATPVRLQVLLIVPGDLEKELHNKFAAFRETGEWFNLSKLENYVAEQRNRQYDNWVEGLLSPSHLPSITPSEWESKISAHVDTLPTRHYGRGIQISTRVLWEVLGVERSRFRAVQIANIMRGLGFYRTRVREKGCKVEVGFVKNT